MGAILLLPMSTLQLLALTFWATYTGFPATDHSS